MKTAKKYYIGFAIVGIFITLRLMLPSILIHYAEHRINKIPGYHVEIGDLDVHLYRGSYTIKDLALYKTDKKIKVPFFSTKTMDLSIQWLALLRGALVGKIELHKPHLNFVMDPTGKNEQLTIDSEWQNAVKALFPLNFNSIGIEEGRLSLQSFKGNPPFNLYLKNINGTIKNMQNVDKEKQLLPSTFTIKANSMDGADAVLNGKFDPFSKQPAFMLAGEIKGMRIKEANNFLKHFTNVDVAKGNFSLYVEAAAAKGNIHGYAKPIIKDLQIIDTKKPMAPIEFLYKGALEIASKIVTNSKKQTIATKININGDIDDPETSTLSIVGYLLRHAFIQALLPQIDHSIHMRDVVIDKKNFRRAG